MKITRDTLKILLIAAAVFAVAELGLLFRDMRSAAKETTATTAEAKAARGMVFVPWQLAGEGLSAIMDDYSDFSRIDEANQIFWITSGAKATPGVRLYASVAIAA